MADLSTSFNPASVATNSDAASDAASKAVVAGSDASDAASAASDAGSKASVALAKASAASVAAGKGSDASSKIAGKSATWDKASAASSKVAASSANWNKASDASSTASEALSRITARSAVWDKKTVILKCLDEASAVEDGDDLMRFTIPNTLSGMNLVSCGAHVYTGPTSSVMVIDIYNITSAVDMLTSAMTIDETEKDTATAASQAVINTGADGVAAGEEIRVDVTDAASGAKGLELRLTFEKP